MKLLSNISIKNKLLAIILFISSVVAFTSLTITTVSNIKKIQDEITAEVSNNARLISQYCVGSIMFRDTLGVSKILNQAANINDLKTIQYYSADEKLIASTNKVNDIVLLKSVKKMPRWSIDEQYMHIIEPSILENNNYGYIYIRLSNDFIKEKINTSIQYTILELLGLIALSFILGNYLQRIVSQPILDLSNTSQKIAVNGDYSMRVKTESKDEFGQLYGNFNNMIEQIQTRQIERDKALAELQESENRFRKITQSTTDAIIVIDKQTKIRHWNEAAEKAFGYTEREIVGQDLRKLILTNQDFELFKQDAIYSEETGSDITNSIIFEFPAVRKNKETFPVEVSIGTVWIKKEWNAVAIMRDISKRKIQEQELIAAKEKAEESDKLKSTFLANMSHEIRTPMNSIIGFAELLTDNKLFEQKKELYLNYIISSGKTLLNLINDILDISKIEAGQLKIMKDMININLILSELFVSYYETNQKNNKKIDIRLSKGFDSEEFFVYTDPYRFKQILNNMLANAYKFTEKGFIEFGFRIKNDKNILFYVRDTGIGIPTEKINHIFEPFGQVEETLSKNLSGAGLGLAISKKLVGMLGGELWVESTPKEGSTFYFTLPYEKSLLQNTKTDISAPSPLKLEGENSWSKKTILIAEDEEVNYTFLVEALSNSNVNIIWAQDGKQAIEICKNTPNIDLILMDIKMPEVDGYEATRMIKSFRPNIPIIAQTAYAMAGEKEKSLKAQCDDFITKPIRVKTLITIVSKYLDNK